MPRTIPEPELEAIEKAITGQPDGISINAIIQRLKITLPRRTLQRRLALLVADGVLHSSGKGRGARYSLSVEDSKKSGSYDHRMTKIRALSLLSKLKPVLTKRFGVTRLALFGSTARNMARPDSDIDIVVAFDGPATSEKYFGVQFLLEDELNHKVDLVTEKALKPELKPFIEREAINV